MPITSLFSVRSSSTLVWRGKIYFSFPSNRQAWIPLKKKNSFYLPVLLDVVFLQLKEKRHYHKVQLQTAEHFWILSFSGQWCSSNVLGCVGYRDSGPEAQMVLLWCNPAQWLVKQTNSFQCFSSKNLFDFTETKLLKLLSYLLPLCWLAMQNALYFSAAQSVESKRQPLL